ncbi:MAG: LolA family protein [Polyangiaceae bacterium]
MRLPLTLTGPYARRLCALLAPLALCGCPGRAPPVSPIPDAHSAIERMRATAAGCNGVQASAKIDHFGKEGRIRGDLLMIVAMPANIRMDIVSPFGASIATLTSDSESFGLSDLRDKKFYVGPATACNIARLTTVPIPGPVLVDLLRGQAPVLKQEKREGPSTDLAWSSHGYYVVHIYGSWNTTEEIHLAPVDEDWNKPWQEQRLRVLDVLVTRDGLVFYHAELSDHSPAPMAKPRVDPDGIDPPLPPSGPTCNAELPRKIHVEVPGLEEDVQFRYDQVTWNPPLPQNIFTQQAPPGMPTVPVTWSDR